jgi:hypothetical protein
MSVCDATNVSGCTTTTAATMYLGVLQAYISNIYIVLCQTEYNPKSDCGYTLYTAYYRNIYEVYTLIRREGGIKDTSVVYKWDQIH